MSLADLMKKGTLRQFATLTVTTTATVSPDRLSSVASVASVSVAIVPKQAANDPASGMTDPDRWCWPHSAAMTGAEIDTLTARLARFTDKGLSLVESEALADKLVMRDRESDDRRLCLECVYLAGHGAGAIRCTNWRRAGVAIKARDAKLSGAQVHRLQRCDGLKEIGL